MQIIHECTYWNYECKKSLKILASEKGCVSCKKKCICLLQQEKMLNCYLLFHQLLYFSFFYRKVFCVVSPRLCLKLQVLYKAKLDKIWFLKMDYQGESENHCLNFPKTYDKQFKNGNNFNWSPLLIRKQLVLI